MFEETGKKLKGWASVLFWLTVIGLIIYGIVEIVSIVKIGYQVGKLVLIILGTITVGIIGAWLSPMVMYTLGDIHEKTDQLLALQNNMKTMAETQQRVEKKVEYLIEHIFQTPESEKTPQADSADIVFCPSCRAINRKSDTICAECGKYLGNSKPAKSAETQKTKSAQIPVVRSKVCPKCHKDNPADYLYCQYCGETLI